MKLITTKELIASPRGTIFREFEPMIFKGDWLRFEGPCNDNDFFYSTIGPHCVNAGYYATSEMPRDLIDAGADPADKAGPYHVTIDDGTGRDGIFDDSRQWVVLEPRDIHLMVEQLTRHRDVPPERFSPPTYLVLKD